MSLPLQSFVMPSKYTKDTLPKPNDPDVVIKEVRLFRLSNCSPTACPGQAIALQQAYIAHSGLLQLCMCTQQYKHQLGAMLVASYSMYVCMHEPDSFVCTAQVESRTAAALTFRGSVRGRDIVNKRRDELLALVKVCCKSTCDSTTCWLAFTAMLLWFLHDLTRTTALILACAAVGAMRCVSY